MAVFTDFTFESSTGVNTIHARKCVPEGSVRGVVQIAHGIAEHVGRYEDFMAFLAENGFVAVANDHLGRPLCPYKRMEICRRRHGTAARHHAG